MLELYGLVSVEVAEAVVQVHLHQHNILQLVVEYKYISSVVQVHLHQYNVLQLVVEYTRGCSSITSPPIQYPAVSSRGCSSSTTPPIQYPTVSCRVH